MKRHAPIIAICLTGVFLFNMLGYCLFSILIISHKKDTFNKIVSGNFHEKELIQLTASDLQTANWEDEKEFEWNEEMYDVVKQEIKDGQTMYTCKKDTKEDILKKNKKEASDKSSEKKMIEMNKIFVQSPTINLPCFIQNVVKKHLTTLKENYSFVHSSFIYSPPKG